VGGWLAALGLLSSCDNFLNEDELDDDFGEEGFYIF
jgi:hypothetical protein